MLTVKSASFCRLLKLTYLTSLMHVCNITQVAKANIWNHLKGRDNLNYWCKQQNADFPTRLMSQKGSAYTGPYDNFHKSVKYVENAYMYYADRRCY